MKVEITNEANGYYIYIQGENRPLKNIRESFLNQFTFQEDDIFNLIGEKKFENDFTNGKYIFNVTKNHLDLICGNRSARSKDELTMYNN